MCIDGFGIIPDYVIGIEYIYNNQNEVDFVDNQFNKALEVINNL